MSEAGTRRLGPFEVSPIGLGCMNLSNDITVAPELIARPDALINEHTVSGARYPAASQAEVDTEAFGAA